MTAEQKRDIWQHHIASWQQSGASQAEYCQQHDLKLTNFSYWRTRLNQPKPARKLIPVDISSTAMIRLTLPNGIRVESPLHALGEVLALLNQTLKAHN